MYLDIDRIDKSRRDMAAYQAMLSGAYDQAAARQQMARDQMIYAQAQAQMAQMSQAQARAQAAQMAQIRAQAAAQAQARMQAEMRARSQAQAPSPIVQQQAPLAQPSQGACVTAPVTGQPQQAVQAISFPASPASSAYDSDRAFVTGIKFQEPDDRDHDEGPGKSGLELRELHLPVPLILLVIACVIVTFVSWSVASANATELTGTGTVSDTAQTFYQDGEDEIDGAAVPQASPDTGTPSEEAGDGATDAALADTGETETASGASVGISDKPYDVRDEQEEMARQITSQVAFEKKAPIKKEEKESKAAEKGDGKSAIAARNEAEQEKDAKDYETGNVDGGEAKGSQDAGAGTKKAKKNKYADMTWRDFAGKSQSEKIELIGAMARKDMKESGILASITCAQALLESGWMDSGLAHYNNLFGIKAGTSGKTWKDSTWNGDYVVMKTKEEYVKGHYTTIKARFRTYATVWDSIKDHSAYLTNCMNGNKLRYFGIVGCKDPEKGFKIIKNGGYATSSKYVRNLMNVVEKYGLTRFDK